MVKRHNENNAQRTFSSIGLPATANGYFSNNINVSTSPEGNTSALTDQVNISNASTPAYSMNSPLEIARRETQTLPSSNSLKVQLAIFI